MPVTFLPDAPGPPPQSPAGVTDVGALAPPPAAAPVTLTVLYDERCPLCRRLRRWLATRPTLTAITFLPADTPAAHRRFPRLDHARTTRILTVVTSDGAVYEGERAWLVCGWALPDWRLVAEHFSTPVGRLTARMAARAVDRYRHRQLPTGGDNCQCALTWEDGRR